LATLFAFNANTLLFLTARKTLKPLRHDLLHHRAPISRKTWWAQGSFDFATMSRVIRIAPVGLRGRFRGGATLWLPAQRNGSDEIKEREE
jgi:hypothetical protein